MFKTKRQIASMKRTSLLGYYCDLIHAHRTDHLDYVETSQIRKVILAIQRDKRRAKRTRWKR